MMFFWLELFGDLAAGNMQVGERPEPDDFCQPVDERCAVWSHVPWCTLDEGRQVGG